MARFAEILLLLVFVIIASVLSAPVPVGPPSDINVTSPQNLTTWRSGTTQAVTWNVGDPKNPVANPGDTVSASVWQFGFGLEPQKVADIGTQIPFDDLNTQYKVPTEPDFTNLGLRYDNFNYWVMVEGDQVNPGGSVLRGESGVFRFTRSIAGLDEASTAPPTSP